VAIDVPLGISLVVALGIGWVVVAVLRGIALLRVLLVITLLLLVQELKLRAVVPLASVAASSVENFILRGS